jgi:CDP-glucose 4,6-dehydratase
LSNINPKFWSGKKVFLTGHSGFKGSWLSFWLHLMGAKVYGFSLPPETSPNLFEVLKIKDILTKSYFDNLSNHESLKKILIDISPDIVIHMAAQPLVRYSYKNPRETYLTNVLGTVNLFEAIRASDSVRASLVVTSDKCYENKEIDYAYSENDSLGGFDPYSSSKACAELVTSAYRQSFYHSNLYSSHCHAIASARSGNVIGGGDWSEDRLIPDLIRALNNQIALKIRNPEAVRPWQHVLEPLSGYLILIQKLYNNGIDFATSWNFGPNDKDTKSVENLIDYFLRSYNAKVLIEQEGKPQPHEANILKLDSSKSIHRLGWKPHWNLDNSIIKTAEWYKAYYFRSDMVKFTFNQIENYIKR